jgi:hypothetical protein
MSSSDDYKIALNIISRIGINSPDFLQEYAKAKSLIHMMDTSNQMQAMNNAPMMTNQPVSAPISGQPDQSTTQEPLGATGLQNAPNTPSIPQGQPTVGKYDNL